MFLSSFFFLAFSYQQSAFSKNFTHLLPNFTVLADR